MSIKNQIIKIILFLFFIISYSCKKENNNELMSKFENDFNDSITKYKAQKFDYKYDGLVPQTSYFVNSKIKFLKYAHGPENGTSVSFVYFNNADSIAKIIKRDITFVFEDNSVKAKNFIDTTTVLFFYPKKKILKYVESKIVDSAFNQSTFESDKSFIYKMKEQTEKKFRQD